MRKMLRRRESEPFSEKDTVFISRSKALGRKSERGKKDKRREEKETRETDQRDGVKKAPSVPAKVKPHTDKRVEQDQPLINNDIIY